MNPFQVERQIKAARDIAERNGFLLEESYHFPDRISLLATKPPYAEDIVIRVFDQWGDVITYFMGYEQHIIEMQFKEVKK